MEFSSNVSWALLPSTRNVNRVLGSSLQRKIGLNMMGWDPLAPLFSLYSWRCYTGVAGTHTSKSHGPRVLWKQPEHPRTKNNSPDSKTQPGEASRAAWLISPQRGLSARGHFYVPRCPITPRALNVLKTSFININWGWFHFRFVTYNIKLHLRYVVVSTWLSYLRPGIKAPADTV